MSHHQLHSADTTIGCSVCTQHEDQVGGEHFLSLDHLLELSPNY